MSYVAVVTKSDIMAVILIDNEFHY